LSILDARSLSPVFYSSSWGGRSGSRPGRGHGAQVRDRAHRLRRPRCSDGCHRLRRTGVVVRDLLPVGLVPRPTFAESGLGCAALVSESRHKVAGHGVRGAPQPCRLVGSLGRAVPHPPGSRRRAPWSESGVRSGPVGNRCRRRCGGAPGGAEQADAADEGRSEAGGIIVVGHSASGCHRGRGQGRAPLAADPQC
jgi:hypothetical protein